MSRLKSFWSVVCAALFFSAGMTHLEAQAQQVQFGSNYYEFVSAIQISHPDATTAASASTFFGVHGHLATITSAAENSFLSGLVSLSGFSGAWLGGRGDPSGFSRWITGPETGQIFSFYGNPYGGAYANWGGIEPNNYGDLGYAYMNVGTTYTDSNGSIFHGQWADNNCGDCIPNAGDPIKGYFVEYESPLVTTPVPEPETYAMLLAGLGLLGWHARRRKLKLAA
jgi:PEP-CTERM motif